MIVRLRLPDGRASQLDVGAMSPELYAQQLANAARMWVKYSTQEKDGKWSDWQECDPTIIIVPITPERAVSMAKAEQEE